MKKEACEKGTTTWKELGFGGRDVLTPLSSLRFSPEAIVRILGLEGGDDERCVHLEQELLK